MKAPIRLTTLSAGICLGLLVAIPAAAKDGDPSPAPAPPGAAPPSTESPDEAARRTAVAEFEADGRLGERLGKVPGDDLLRTRYLLDTAWSESEPDASLRSAALRRLDQTEPRIVTSVITARIALSPPEEQLGMLEITRRIYGKIGGVDSALDEALSDRIRDRNERVAAKAMEVLAELKVPSAYLPMREIASTPGSPLREQAVVAIARLGDPRAVVFFKKLLESEDIPRQTIYQGLGAIGRPAALFLKEKLNSPRPEDRDLACDALVGIANGDDLSALYAYIRKYPPQGERKMRVYDAIASIEARGNERPAGSGD